MGKFKKEKGCTPNNNLCKCGVHLVFVAYTFGTSVITAFKRLTTFMLFLEV